jgi:hypothetical protein
MAATRILDENSHLVESLELALRRKDHIHDENLIKTNEAYLFMRDEVARRAEVSL